MRGNTGAGPLKVLDEKSLAAGGQRWRFIPLQNRLDSTSARPATLPSLQFETNLDQLHSDDTSVSHFATALETNSEINITATFTGYVRQVKPLSHSLPLIYRNRKKLFTLTVDALQLSTRNAAEATPAIAKCLTALSKDLGPQQFHPFFPQVVDLFSLVFDMSRHQDNAKGTNVAKAFITCSVFWNPELSIVPLFAALSEISKNHLQCLASDPEQTLRDLLPLLGHSHYRVREMTAESCLGYLLRKTRDLAVLKQLTRHLLDVSTAAGNVTGMESTLLDGLGASLFEAMRLPSGRLHTRGPQILAFALKRLEEVCPRGVTKVSGNESEFEERILRVISLCLARLSRHLTNPSDIQTIMVLFLKTGEDAKKQANAAQVGHVSFISRKWLQRRGSGAIFVRDRATLQKFLSALADWVGHFVFAPRVIYECLGGICSIVSLSSEDNIRQSSRRALCSALAKVSNSTRAESVFCATAVLLKSQVVFRGNLMDLSIVQAFGALCDQLAKISIEEISTPSVQVSTIALQRVLTFLRTMYESGTDSTLHYRNSFRVPTLEAQIKAVLSHSSAALLKSPRDQLGCSVIRYGLRYLSIVQVDNHTDVFENLLSSEDLCMDDCGLLLEAFCRQMNGRIKDISPLLAARTNVLVDRLLNDVENSASSTVISALNKYFRLFPFESKKRFARRPQSFERFVSRLSENLSSLQSSVRLHSAELLSSISGLLACSESVPERTDGDEVHGIDGLQSRIESLRSSLGAHDACLLGFFESLRYVCVAIRSLSRIDDTLRVLREIARLLRDSENVNRVAVIASIHFSIGLLRTPFKTLWNNAGDIWSAAAGHLSEDAMALMMQEVNTAESRLVSACSANREEPADASEDKLVCVVAKNSVQKGDAECRTKDGITAFGQGSLSCQPCIKRRRTGEKSPKTELVTVAVSERQEADEREASWRQWDGNEWMQYCADSRDCGIAELGRSKSMGSVPVMMDSFTDDLTFLQEVLRTLTKEPQHAVAVRSQLISSYLRLDPSMFSRRMGNSLATSFVVLLEKMGALLHRDEGVLEQSLRCRLLSDLTRSCPALQTISLKCLCASQSTSLKRYRDSFIRLIEDASFRDELTALAESLLPNISLSETGNLLDNDGDFTLDVLVRICFSKMTGKVDRNDSRRSAVLSFVVSKLPVGIALPRIISLVLSPIADIVDEVGVSVREQEPVVDGQRFPDLNVQLGLLNSIESIMKQCRRSLAASSWCRIAVGCFVLLRNAGTGTAGKNLRSRSLRILADMFHARGEETSFLAMPVLRAMRGAKFEVNGRTAGRGVPGLLHFMSSVYSDNLPAVQKAIVLRELWAVRWSLNILKDENTELETVKVSLGVAQGLAGLILADSMSSSKQPDVLLPGSPRYEDVCSMLLCSLRALLSRLVKDVLRDRSLRKAWGPVFDRALDILERLVDAPSLKSEDLVGLSDGLVVYLENTVSFSDSCERTLKVLTAMSEQLCERKGTEDKRNAEDHIGQVRRSVLRLLPLLANVQFINDSKCYLQFCRLLGSLDAPDLRAVSAPLQAMNAMKSSQLDSPDLDRRIDGLNCVIKPFKDALEEPSDGENYATREVLFRLDGDSAFGSSRIICRTDSITALVYGCIASVMSDDVAVRGTSSYALQLIGKWSAVSGSQSAKICQRRMFKLLLEAVVSARNGIVRREYTRGLAELVWRSQYIDETKDWSGYSIFSLLKDVSKPNDLDSDFFENVVHLQAHRRGRALRQIQKEVLDADQRMVMDDDVKYEAYTSFASIFSLPLGMQIALELSEDDERCSVGSRHAESRESAAKDVAVWAVAVVGASARWLRWSGLKSCICDLLRKLRHCASEKRAQTLYKLLVAVVEAFPELPSARQGPDSCIREFLVETLLPTMLNHISAGGVEGDVVLDIAEAVTLTKGEHQRRRSAPGIFRAPVAIAVAHLVTRLADSDVDAVIPRLVTPLANALRSRKMAMRDSAKKALTSVVLTLGSNYLPYVLRQVLSALGEGFRKDACVYVIHSLLGGIRDSAREVPTGGSGNILSVDEAAGMIAIHLSEELERGTTVTINDFEDPNASSFFQKQASLRAAKAFDCAEMLAEYVTFDRSARIVLQPFEKLLAHTSSAKLVSRVENIFHRIITGFTKNSSMRPGDALKICYELISAPSGFEAGESAESLQKDGPVCFRGRDVLKKTTGNGYSIVTFGFQLLCNVVNRNSVLLRDTSCEARELQGMLGPFLPLIAQALQTKHNSLTVTALRAAQKLLKLPVAHKAFTGEIMSERIVDVLSQNAGLVTNSDDLFNSCLRAASVLIYEVGDNGFKTLSRERVEALTSISCKCMESGGLETRSAALALLKAVVSSRIMIPAVYDAIERVNEMAIHSQSSSLRSSCSALSVQFAVSFPLGSRRVRQHLEFFVRNLNYELSSGRCAALEVIKAIVLKFPAEVLEEECQYLFVALAASVARDSDPKCRSCSSHALQLLFERVPIGRHITSMLKMASLLAGVISDMTSLDEEMKITSSVDDDVQLSGAFALMAACKSGRLSSVQLHLIARVLVTALTGRRGTAPWETTYSLLHGLEIAFDVQKATTRSERLETEHQTRVFWEAMPSLLLHQHPWVRLSSARLLGSHLSAGGDQSAGSQTRPNVQFSLLWDSRGLVRATLKSCCAQLEALGLSEDLGQQCLKNLLCMANVIFKNPDVGDLASEENTLEDGKDDANAEASGLSVSQCKNRGLNWLLYRMSGLAHRAGEEAADILRRGCALRFLLVSAQWWGFDFVILYKKLYIAPIVKALERQISTNSYPKPEMGRESSARSGDEGIGMRGLKEIARTLQDVLVEGLGATAYYEVYQGLRRERDKAKQTRKRQAAFELAVNPERAAKRRRKKAESRRSKRSVMSVDAFRGTKEKNTTPRNPKNYLTHDL